MNQDPKIIETSESEIIQGITEINSKNWMRRTFGKMEEGSLRGNMFLLIVTTIGSTFFILPHSARQIGIFLTALMLFASAFLSFYCSQMLYLGYKETKAKTYNECMEGMLGKKMGFLSTVVITLHTFGSAISTFIFSWKYIDAGIKKFLGIEISADSNTLLNQNVFFFLGIVVIYVVTLFRSIEKLKVISIFGFFLVIALVMVFLSMTEEYFEHYNSMGLISLVPFDFNVYGLKVWGICNYLFLNQYAITPICSNTKEVSLKRVSKIVWRAIFSIAFLYILTLFCGYFSLPTNINNEIFLLRPPITGNSDTLIKYGIFLFGCALFVGVTVRSYFLLIYFDQFIGKFKEVFLNAGKSEVYIAIGNESNGETNSMNSNRHLLVWKPNAMIRNFLFLTVMGILTSLGVNKLLSILGLIGSFVGVFELIIFPSLMFLAISKKRNIMGNWTRRVFVFSMIFLTCLSICSVFANILI